MRKLLIILSVLFLILSCGKDPDIEKEIGDKYLKPLSEWIKSFKIEDTTGLTINSWQALLPDTSCTILSGMRNKHPWFGKFKNSTKEQIFEWSDSDILPQKREEENISYCKLGGPIYQFGDNYVFCVYTYSVPDIISFNDLYFVTKESTIKYKQNTETYTKIYPWSETTIISEGVHQQCFNIMGEKLYTVHEGLKAGTPINIEECILESLSGFKRVNLKTGEAAWSSDRIFEDIPITTSTVFTKQNAKGVSWEYLVHIMEGIKVKETRTLNVNIETGKIEYK